MQAKYFTTIHMLTPCIQPMAEPEEVAHAVLFLASSKASYVTGICMRMDGALNPIEV
jgi:NAD(P)-dependent dehydrogenase (short-subunit alcohol dehydrogenase family)